MNAKSAVIQLFSCAALVGASVGLAARAEASPIVDNYVAAFAGTVCGALDILPTLNGVIGVGQAIASDGLTYEEAGEIIAKSVYLYCPRHSELIRRFIETYSPSAAPVVLR